MISRYNYSFRQGMYVFNEGYTPFNFAFIRNNEMHCWFFYVYFFGLRFSGHF